MTKTSPIVVIGAGIVGVSTAIWLRRAGHEVLLVDRGEPGQGTSYGNGGILASCSVVPVTVPGLLFKGPRYLLNPNFPLFLRWSYLPKLAPWLLKYLSYANDEQTRRISSGIEIVTGDSVEQHFALAKGTAAERWLQKSDYVFAYRNRAAFEADAYVWELRRAAGFVPDLIEGSDVKDYDPLYGPKVTFLARMKNHGYVLSPGNYVAALAEVLKSEGGEIRQASVKDVEFTDGSATAVLTDQGRIACSQVVLCTGVWSGPLAKKLGVSPRIQSERGYHIMFKSPNMRIRSPSMIAAGKFVATPMEDGLRCAGIVEFGGLEAGPSKAPLALLRKTVKETFPDLRWQEEEEWLGHRPSTADSLPLIGQVGNSGVFMGFGHQHIGLTGGPKTGRILADMISGKNTNIDLSPFDPQRFGSRNTELVQ